LPTVLLVEDHDDTRQMYAEFLGMSFDVICAADGEKGLALLRERRMDLVITDLSLPGMNGFELVAAIRNEPSLRDTPIVCLSGYGGLAHEQRARAAGCDRILQKPVMPDTLADVATDLIRQAADRSSKP
jgi:two-component system CheB/CheR fusion protein